MRNWKTILLLILIIIIVTLVSRIDILQFNDKKTIDIPIEICHQWVEEGVNNGCYYGCSDTFEYLFPMLNKGNYSKYEQKYIDCYEICDR